ncbi:MAG: hypothetical protein ACI9KN_002570 [Gammaproteobacteria bacterium]|jgi:hypothetical protein
MMLAASAIFLTTDQRQVLDNPIRSVHARSRGRGGWINIAQHAEVTGDREIQIVVDGNRRIRDLLVDNHEIEVRVRTREQSEYLGHSIGNFCCMRINESGSLAQSKTTVLQTLPHEVGHGCQQVIRRERIYNAVGAATGWDTNPMWHTDNFGGQGPHCATNAAKQPPTDTTSGEIYGWNSGTLCTMFFRRSRMLILRAGFATSVSRG